MFSSLFLFVIFSRLSLDSNIYKMNFCTFYTFCTFWFRFLLRNISILFISNRIFRYDEHAISFNQATSWKVDICFYYLIESFFCEKSCLKHWHFCSNGWFGCRHFFCLWQPQCWVVSYVDRVQFQDQGLLVCTRLEAR